MQTAHRLTRTTTQDTQGAREAGEWETLMLGSCSLNTCAQGSTTGPGGQMGFYTLSPLVGHRAEGGDTGGRG